MFLYGSKENSDYFPVKINWLDFIMETEGVYCAVRAEYLTMRIILAFKELIIFRKECYIKYTIWFV
jgi:hypothetical protein